MELTRLLNKPHAALREAGLDIAADATHIPVVVVPGTGATPTGVTVFPVRDIEGDIVGWNAFVIENGQLVETIPIHEVVSQ
jgi:hypothetical protein